MNRSPPDETAVVTGAFLPACGLGRRILGLCRAAAVAVMWTALVVFVAPPASAAPLNDALKELSRLVEKKNPSQKDYAAMAAQVEKALALAATQKDIDPELIAELRKNLPEFYREAGGGDKMFAAYLDYFGFLTANTQNYEELRRVIRAVTLLHVQAATPERTLDAFASLTERAEFAGFRDNLSARIYMIMQQVLVHEWQIDLGIKAGLRSLEHLRKLGPSADLVTTTVLNDLGYAHLSALRLPEALDYLTQSLRLRERVDPNNLQEIGSTCQNLGLVLNALGDFDTARSYAERALKARRAALGDKHPKYAETLTLLAALASRDQDYEKVIQLFDEAREIYRVNNDQEGAAIMAHRLASQYSAMKDYDRALPKIEEMIGWFSTNDHVNPLDFAMVLIERARIELERGLPPVRDADVHRAVDLMVKRMPAGHVSTVSILFDAAEFFALRGDLATADRYIGQAMDALQQRIRVAREKIGSDVGSDASSNVLNANSIMPMLLGIAVREHGGAVAPARVARLFSTVQWGELTETNAALHRMAARLSAPDPQLAAKVRRTQDLSNRRDDVDNRLVRAQAVDIGARDENRIRALQAELASLQAELSTATAETRASFPRYAALALPEPSSVADVRRLLRDDEVLIKYYVPPALYATVYKDDSFVWVVTKETERLLRIPVGPSALTDQVQALRCGLDASNWTDPSGWVVRDERDARRKKTQAERRRRCIDLLGLEVSDTDTLPFDLVRAHELYETLLGPIRDLIAGKHLLVVPSGPLTTLPFAALVTDKPGIADSMREAYRKAAWLGLRQPITVLPSVSSLDALRKHAKAGPRPSKRFIGFGNPLVSGADGEDRRAWAAQTCRDAPILLAQATALPPDANSVFRGGAADLATLRRQSPLPETADELCAVARRLNVSESDVRLGERMTELEIRRLSADGELEKYSVVHFATHGLVAGNLKGLAEPALLLTPPADAGDKDDGLLTASEVAELVLNADWVVMSACNTAAGRSDNADALSGLARAFFYAGARALLVSHWPVYSRAAVKLTTGTFAALESQPGIGRAEALRRAMREIVEADAVDPADSSRSEAHPAFWAPFIVVGEGGAGGG